MLFCGFDASAQYGFMYRQYVLNQMAFNPGYTGSREVFSLAAMVRSQWTGIEGAPITQSFSSNAPLKKNKVAMGMYLMNETMGSIGNTNLEFNYAYRISFERSKLSLGLKASVNSYRNRVPDNINDPNDLTFIGSEENYIFPNFGVGAYYYGYNRFFIGLSVPYLLGYSYESSSSKYKIGYSPENYGFIFSSGILMNYGEYVKSRLSGMAQYNKLSDTDFDINLMFIFLDKFWAGGSYNTVGYRTMMMQVQVNPQIKVGFSYDISSGALEYLPGSYEVMIQYLFDYKINALNPRYF